jgi:hypothetical protein
MGIFDVFKKKDVSKVDSRIQIDVNTRLKRQSEVKNPPQIGDYIKVENGVLNLETEKLPYINGNFEVVTDDANTNELYTPKGMANWAREELIDSIELSIYKYNEECLEQIADYNKFKSDALSPNTTKTQEDIKARRNHNDSKMNALTEKINKCNTQLEYAKTADFDTPRLDISIIMFLMRRESNLSGEKFSSALKAYLDSNQN